VFQVNTSDIKSPGLGPTRHTFRRVADESSKAETALSGSVNTSDIKCINFIAHQLPAGPA